MTKQTWQAARPDFQPYRELFETSNSDNNDVDLLTLQPRFNSAIKHFCTPLNQAKFLFVHAPDVLFYRQFVNQSLIRNSQNLTTQPPIIHAEHLNLELILGQYQDTETIAGYLEQAHQGYLIVSAQAILNNHKTWPTLKSAIQGSPFKKLATDSKLLPSSSIQSESYDVRLIIVGDRYQLAEIEAMDDSIRSLNFDFAEIEDTLKVNKGNLSLYKHYVNGLIEENKLVNFADFDAWQAFLAEATRQTEDQSQLPLCPIWHAQTLAEFLIASAENIKSDKATLITQHHIQSALQAQNERHAYLPLRALDDILDGNVIIETQGERVGQVNGLTVIEVPGHPVCYGEPARISCVIHFGDGDIADVERKAELGGNLHAKGMMIMQAFLSSALDLNEPLPFAASIVFEQSYSEVDGDSASLAELCTLVSALSETPINQQIAVTGAVDQFGRVQAVGGLNEKIEGFFKVCQHQGLTGNQGVLLPRSNLKHLSLNQDVVDAMKDDKFHLWSVESVDEAIPLIFNKAFRGDDDDTILKKIAERIEQLDQDKLEQNQLTFMQKLANLFKND